MFRNEILRNWSARGLKLYQTYVCYSYCKYFINDLYINLHVFIADLVFSTTLADNWFDDNEDELMMISETSG